MALLAGVLGVAAISQAAQAEPAPPPASSPEVAGWDEFIESLRSLPGRMLAKLPEPMRKDPQVQQEVARLALESLASQSLDAIGGDADHPEFLPTISYLLNVGQPNADTIYRSARIDPAGTYRLTGKRGTLNLAVIGQVVPRNAETGQGRAHLDLNALHYDRDGHYSVLISAARPASYTGDWWELRPAASRLMLRLVASDWAKEVAPTLSLERLDRPAPRPRRAAADLEARLRALPRMVDMMALMFVDHVEQLRKEGYVNKFKVFDITSGGGLAGQFYYEGAYDLAEDEALIVSAKVPQQCGYRSLILTNELYETTDWYNNHASLNAAQAPADKDGVLRIVVSAKDPGVPNWLDTSGHARGAIQGRWTDCDSQPIPEVIKVPLAEVRKHLPSETPAITPDQRDKVIRARRAAQMQRPFW
ncbi:MAG: hypothetical protein KGL44_03205 [Sphingomonadales bacterium]|nr:hypothetical protein [Sphingomonadales bacterium]